MSLLTEIILHIKDIKIFHEKKKNSKWNKFSENRIDDSEYSKDIFNKIMNQKYKISGCFY